MNPSIIHYSRNQSLRINDAEVDGGAQQLRRFADYLRMVLR